MKHFHNIKYLQSLNHEVNMMNRHMLPPSCFFSHLNVLTWKIFWLQVLFSLVIVCTTSFATADDNSCFLLHRKLMEPPRTQTYLLREGETVGSVAKKYNSSVDLLREINQFRTFTQDFDKIQPGNELNVPLTPLPEVIWDNTSVSSIFNRNDDIQEKKTGDIASNKIHNLLNYHGTARLRLDSDRNFSLKNSQLDLLIPLYEEKGALAFTQGIIHRTDNRVQSNLGLGYRWFVNNWMLSTNAFFDYDLSRNHARLGFGSEYWRDFLRLGVNTYLHLTRWKNSQNLDNYKEQPTGGWDIRAQYWLPSLPQLSGKFVYEQYYGNEDTLFDQSNYQKNPHGVIVSVNYTPIPLLTFSAEKQYQRHLSKSSTRFIMNMKYQFGQPWQYQINPNVISRNKLRLFENRYDLVDRNNNISLNFYEKEVIHLDTTDLIVGYPKEYKFLKASTNSRYGLERIDWSIPQQFIAAGGKIIKNREDWMVIMPMYRLGSEAINSYMISGVAIDKKGNISGRADTQVTVVQQAITNTRINSFISSSSGASSENEGRFLRQQASIKASNQEKDEPVDITGNVSIFQRFISFLG